MSWRGQGVTGSNNIPLGNRRRFGDDAPSDDGESLRSRGRSRSPVREPVQHAADGIRKRRKKNRWGAATDNKAAGLMGLPTEIKAAMTTEQLDAYILNLRIEEISQKLRINDVVPAEGDRSPSPPPQYDNFGRRVNTREARYRKKLEDERHKLVEKAMKTIPNYRPPSDYKRPTKTQEKVYVPVNDYPEINFIGLLIGPRGNTLKKMEGESGAKIAIRGKGSVKEGKGRSDAAHASNQEEDLHCLIMADTEEKVNKAKRLINNIIETAASIPEGQNELKRNQLRELAALNGTLRDDENQACQNCGQIGHRKYDCPEQRNFTANIICRICGNAGHMARDCPDRRGGWRPDGHDSRPQARIENQADREYADLMAELTGQPAGAGPQHRIEAGPGSQDNQQQDSLPPWQRGATGGPAPWARNTRDDRDGPSSAAPPWASRNDSYSGYGQQPSSGYGVPTGPGGAAPWQQPPQQNAYSGYNGYAGYDPSASYGQMPAAVPGMAPWQQYGSAVSPPPGPPGDVPPPPPPPMDEAPPPPPPM